MPRIGVRPAEDRVPTSTAAEGRSAEDRITDLEARIEELEARARRDDEAVKPKPSPIQLSGYADVGFFVPSGNGAGIIQDVGNAHVPSLSNYGWVFLGDILSTAVNSRGEAADLGNEPGVTRFDSVHSQGAASFIANEINLAIDVLLAERAMLHTSVDFVPRTGSDFSLGDFIDVDLAELEWVVSEDQKTRIYVGKVESVIGIEYRERKSNRRFGITPSLVARYTTGTQLGLEARSKLFDDHLILAAAVTNGSWTVEQFHFSSEIDSNNGKTISGRIAWNQPIALSELFTGAIQIGFSGEWGPQDRARDNEGIMWVAALDFEYTSVAFDVKAQILRGRSPGRPVDGVYALDLHPSGYVEVDAMLTPMFGVLARFDLRDALVTLGTERAYLTKSWRATGGLRAVISDAIAMKAEYLRNGDYGEVPSFAHDVFTSSLVLSY